MNPQGSIVLALIGFFYLAWIVNLTWRAKMHASYAVIWIFWIILGVILVTVYPLLDFVTNLVGAIFPASALSLLAFGLLFAMQIYLLSQLSILSRRISLIAQHLAIENAQKGSPKS